MGISPLLFIPVHLDARPPSQFCRASADADVHARQQRSKPFKPSTHRRRRRDSTVELSHVGGVNASIGSRYPVYKWFPVLFSYRLATSDDITTSLLKKLSMSIKVHVVKPLWSLVSFQIVDRIRRQSPWASRECSHRRRDATRQLSRVGGVC